MMGAARFRRKPPSPTEADRRPSERDPVFTAQIIYILDRSCIGLAVVMAEPRTLYEQDFLAWSKRQADALRSAARGGSNALLDWENLAEEIESSGISQRRELKSQIRRVLEHLLKLENSPAIEPRAGWIESIVDARNEIEAVVEDSPSLKREIGTAITAEIKRASRKAIKELEKHGPIGPPLLARIGNTVYTEEEVLGDWFPSEPSAGDERG
jgi:hypothetical protein